MKTTQAPLRATAPEVSSLREPVSVVIADDSAIVRKRLRALLDEEPRVNVVGEAAGALEAWLLVQRSRPRAVVLDLQMPDGNGLDVARRIKQSAPWCVVIILTNVRGAPSHQECRCLGVDYFFHKATEFERVVEVLRDLDAPAAP